MSDREPTKMPGTENWLSRRVGPGLIQKLFDSYKDQFVALLRREVESIARAEAQRVIDVVRGHDWDRYHSILHEAHALALRDSAQFTLQNMPKARSFPLPHDTLRHALSLAPSGGMTLEFGVYSGTTLRIIAESRKGQGLVYGFDSFEGLPEAWRTDFQKGAFAVDELPKVDGAELVKGWFDQTLPAFLERHPGFVDFLHVDCDLYSSTKTVFDLVGPRLRPGSVVLFDEFFNYPGWQQHEYKAWNEFLEQTGLHCTYEAYTVCSEQVVARIVS